VSWLPPPLPLRRLGISITVWWYGSNICHVLVDRDSGEVLGEDVSPPRVRLTEEVVSKPSSGESMVESADA
jgi:hypothetical protein